MMHRGEMLRIDDFLLGVPQKTLEKGKWSLSKSKRKAPLPKKCAEENVVVLPSPEKRS